MIIFDSSCVGYAARSWCLVLQLVCSRSQPQKGDLLSIKYAEVIKSCIFSWIWGTTWNICVRLFYLLLFDLFIANSWKSVYFVIKPDLQWWLNSFDYKLYVVSWGFLSGQKTSIGRWEYMMPPGKMDGLIFFRMV